MCFAVLFISILLDSFAINIILVSHKQICVFKSVFRGLKKAALCEFGSEL